MNWRAAVPIVLELATFDGEALADAGGNCVLCPGYPLRLSPATRFPKTHDPGCLYRRAWEMAEEGER